jgi:hypothetical protein
MRTRGRTDANQSEVVKQLRQMGASVAIISSVGGGVPDLIVGVAGRNYLVELKDPNKPPSERLLTNEEETFRRSWSGQWMIGFTAQQIMQDLRKIGREIVCVGYPRLEP